MTRLPRRLATAVAAGALALAGLALGSPAQAANGFIATPNGMVGVPQTITVYAPGAAGQTATIGVQSGPFATTLQTAIGSNGYGAVTWTPTGAGAWTFNGLGSALSAGSSTITIAPMPTYTVLLAQNAIQQGVNNVLQGAVVAPIGSLAPQGTVTLSTSGGAAFTTQPISGLFGNSTGTVGLPWSPTTSGPMSLQASYTPSSGSFLASTSPVSTPAVQVNDPTVALRFPANLYAGTPTVLQAVLGTGIPAGSAAFSLNGQGISGSIATVNGVATLQWTPPSSGVQTIQVNYSSSDGKFSGVSSQVVNVQGARAQDSITVDPVGVAPAWSIAQPIIMRAGTSLTLAGTSQSGTTVLFSEDGPCVIAGAQLQALSAGTCQVTAQSPGSATLTPGSKTYTVTVTAPPRKRR